MAPARKKAQGDSQPDIPQTILRSDPHAQAIWKATHDSAVATYGAGGRAHRVAFAALTHQYEKRGDEWVKKAEPGPSDLSRVGLLMDGMRKH